MKVHINKSSNATAKPVTKKKKTHNKCKNAVAKSKTREYLPKTDRADHILIANQQQRVWVWMNNPTAEFTGEIWALKDHLYDDVLDTLLGIALIWGFACWKLWNFDWLFRKRIILNDFKCNNLSNFIINYK